MAAGFGDVLRGLGSVLNPAVAQGLQQEGLINAQGDERMQQLMLAQVIKGVESGSIDPAKLQGTPLAGMGPDAQTQARMQAQAQDSQFRQEMGALGPNAEPDALAAVAVKHGKPELALQFTKAKEDRAARLQTAADNLSMRQQTLDQQKELALQRAADQKERDAINAGFRQQTIALQQQGLDLKAELGRMGINASADKQSAAADKQTQTNVTKLGAALEKANLPEADAVLGAVKSAIAKAPNLAEYLSGPKSLLPDMAVPAEIQAGRQAFQKLFNITLKNRSGAAVTIPEFERLKAEFGSGALKTPQMIQNAIDQAQNIISKHYASVAAGFGPDALNGYNENVRQFGGNVVIDPKGAAAPVDATGGWVVKEKK